MTSVRRNCADGRGRKAMAGLDRATAARLAGMDRQTLRDWVHRYNEEGIAGLSNRPLPGRSPKLTEGQMAALKAVVLAGRDPAVDGVPDFADSTLHSAIFAEQVIDRRGGP